MKLISQITFVTIIFLSFLAVESALCKDDNIQLNDLIGIWTQDMTGDYLRSVVKFSKDGTYIIAYDVEKIETRPTEKGQIEIEEMNITLIPLESHMCETTHGRYAINIVEKSKLEFNVQEDQCIPRRDTFGRKLIRINP